MKKYAGSGSLRAGAMPACGGKKEEATGTGAAAGQNRIGGIMAEEKGTIVLVGFYNIKALGVRYLESALKKNGWRVVTVFYKNFNSVRRSRRRRRSCLFLSSV